MSWRAPRALLLAAALAPAAGGAADAVPGIEQPRPFGHVVGDVLTQRVRLAADAPLPAASLPGPQRLSAWIERRAARVEQAADGGRWLVVDYQLVNAPQSPTRVRIPSWKVPVDSPAQIVPAWPVGVAPITARAAPGTDGWQMRPDKPPSAIATGPLRARLVLASAALIACLATWGGWLAWRRWRDTLTQPFAGALHALGRDDGWNAPAWRALHEAFDRTAGEVLRLSTLPRLFERAPQYAPLRDRIEDFYARSAVRFFAGKLDTRPASDASPQALCRALRRIEQRSQR